MKYLLFEMKGDDIGLLTIHRPEALNALNSEVVAEFKACLADIAGKGLRCLIVTGAGEKSFVAGADIAEMKSLSPEEGKAFSVAGNEVMEALEGFPCPVIAAVNGYALGGGFELALACDIRLASERASFAFPEAGLGIPPGYGGIQRAARLAGLAKAKELIFTAARIKADEALAIGLVNRVYPAEQLLPEALSLAEKIAANAPRAIAAAKSVANGSAGLTLKEATRLESGVFGECFATADQKEAMAAFVEKRPHAPFTGK
jgi:enoyl-CoA hydratase